MVRALFLIDDDQDDREIFQEAMQHSNPSVKVTVARDGMEALEILKEKKVLPDVIFLDFNMPRMNGLECLKKLKGESRTKSIPTIIYTTSVDREQEKVMLLLGADHYMQKTTSFVQLCDDLKTLINRFDAKVSSKSN